MTQIAHLSDLHLLEDSCETRTGLARRRLTYLTIGRSRDPGRRRLRAQRALVEARRSGAEHLVITGDLTEDGHDHQFEALAQVLAASGWPPASVTLVPGNHDAYTDGEGFSRALDGPLRAFRATSTPGVAVALRDVSILPMSTAVPQSYLRSAGSLSVAQLASAATVSDSARSSGRAVVLAMHHPPLRHELAPLHWIDGLRGHAAVGELLRDNDHAHVLHGHTHMAADRPVRPGASPRIFSTEAVVGSTSPLRVYFARHGRLWPEPRREPSGISVARA